MKRNLIGILTLVVLSLLVTTGAFAQSYSKANVPFAFNVGSSHMAAGSYQISWPNQNTIIVRNGKTNAAVFSLVGREYARDREPVLVFHRCGGQYFLSEILRGAGTDGLKIPTSKLEREIEASNHQTGEQVLVALK